VSDRGLQVALLYFQFETINCHKQENTTRETQTNFTFKCAIVFIGLRFIHELTTRKGSNEFRFDFESVHGVKGFDKFGSFWVGSGPGYQMHVGSRISMSGCMYTYFY